MKWKKGNRYLTSYGIATVVRVWDTGKAAEFRIEIPDRESARLGWRQGAKFMAHLNDEVSPSPKTWKQVTLPSTEEREKARQKLAEKGRQILRSRGGNF